MVFCSLLLPCLCTSDVIGTDVNLFLKLNYICTYVIKNSESLRIIIRYIFSVEHNLLYISIIHQSLEAKFSWRKDAFSCNIFQLQESVFS